MANILRDNGIAGKIPRGTAGLHLLSRPRIFRNEVRMKNPRKSNGALRRKYRERLRAMAAPCGICHGRLGPIHYDEPSDAQHPFSFVIDEIKPVSRWREFGYDSPEAAAQDWNNLQAAHYVCNSVKGNGLHKRKEKPVAVNIPDGDW